MHSGLWRSGSSLDLAGQEPPPPPEGRLRRVLTAHTRRRSRRNNEPINPLTPINAHPPAGSSKEALRVALSAPLNYTHGSTGGEWVSRRGVFSCRNYSSVEPLPQVDGSDRDGGRRFRVEGSDDLNEQEDGCFGSPAAPVLENPEIQTRWYFKYFLGKVHQNYVGVDEEKNPFFLSVVVLDGHHCRAILWRKTGAQKISLPTTNRSFHAKQILSHFPHMEKLEKGPKEILTPDIQKDLLLLEEQEGSVNFKFGVLYAKPGQQTDDQMLANECGSPEFEEFLTLLGDRIRLKGWDHYRGGLDVKGDMTGRESVYTVYEGHEIMFHVSTLLPLSSDSQQVERKRHIGNDIVNLVFLDDPNEVLDFDPALIKSQFTHVFAVVARASGTYRLAVFVENTVPPFGPSLPSPAVFTDLQDFREFLLVKLINGEKAAFNTPTFAQKRERTLDLLIKDMYAEVGTDAKEWMLARNSLTDMIVEPSWGFRRKEEARQIEFVRFGQALKLDTIVKGDAPTSLATTGLYRRAPWEPHCVLASLPDDVHCGDAWGDDGLLLATQGGVLLLHNDHNDHNDHDQHLVIDCAVTVRQLSVLEAHGILIIRGDKGRDSKMYVFRLSDFSGPSPAFKTKQHLKEHRLVRTKGCHLYALSGPHGSHLRVVAAVGRRLVVMQWRHSAAWTAWCPSSDTDTVHGFDYLNEVSASEVPCVMTLLDAASPSSDNLICVAFRHQFDILSERTGEVLTTYAVDATRILFMDALRLADDVDAHSQLLLCYNNTCHLHEARGCSSQPDFHWNVEPRAVVSAFPFLLAFGPDQLEIRLVINGSLVATLALPRLSLVSAKADLLFATTAPEMDDSPSDSPEPGENRGTRPLRLFCIPRRQLCGSPRALRPLAPPPRVPPPTVHLLAPQPARPLSRSCSSSPTAVQATPFPS